MDNQESQFLRYLSFPGYGSLEAMTNEGLMTEVEGVKLSWASMQGLGDGEQSL